MKTTIRTFKLFILFCCSLATTAAFGQVTQVFDGHSLTNLPVPAITNIDIATNYVSGVAPSANNGDTAEFDGLLPGNLSLGYNGGWQSGPGNSGVTLHLSATQTGSITIQNLAGLQNPPNFAMNGLQLDAGAGALSIGGETTNFNYAGRPGGAVHQLINNSTSLVTIGSMFHLIAGGGTPFSFDFMGTGDFLVRSLIVTDNTPNNNTTFQVDTTGTVTWTPTPAPADHVFLNAIAAVNVNAGLLIMTTNHPKIGNTPFLINNAAFRFDAPGALQIISGTVSGFGVLQVKNGTLSLSGQNTLGGTNLLSGGTLIANSAETVGASGPLGSGSVISFAGGTLAYTVNNAFDYSPRFDTSAGQLYSIDTAGQVVTYSNALTSAGGSLTKLGAGTLTLAGANTYSGPTVVSGGKLVIQRLSGTGNITVNDGTSLGITENDSQVKPSVLTFGTTAGATLEFNNVTNKNTPSLVANTISAAGPITININSGVFGTIGQTYPLFSWISGSAPAVTLGNVSGAAGTLSTNANTIVLTITSTPYVWTGAASGFWDTATPGNWVQSGLPVTFANGVLAVFDDTASGSTALAIGGVVQPASITFANNNLGYSIASTPGNFIGGSGSLTMNGNNVVTLAGGVNTNSGGTILNSGTVSIGVLANGGAPSDIGAATNGPAGLVLNGGALQYTGPAVDIDRQFTLGSSGGTIDSSGAGALRLTNTASVALSGSGPRTLSLTGTLADTNTLAANIANSSSGATALTKNGPGLWILTGTNAYSGLTTINNGALQIGVGAGSGTIGTGPVDNNHGLDFNRTGTVTVSGSVSGTGAVTNDGSGTLVLAANNSFSGGLVINAGTVQIGTGGTTGSLNTGSQIIDNGTAVFNNKNPITISGFGANISGTGNVRIATGTLKATGANTYTGWTEIDSGATFQPSDGNSGTFAGLAVITNNGTIFMTRQDTAVFGLTNNIVGTGKVVVDTGNQNAGLVVLAGTNTYTGGTFIGGAGIVLGDGITPGGGSIVGSVVFTNTTGPSTATFSQNKMLVLNRPDNFTFTNVLLSRVSDGSSAANSGSLVQVGPGNVTITGNNNYPGTTTAGGGTMVIGDGGTNGSIGSGGSGIVITNNATLVMNRSDAVSLTNVISDNVANGLGAGTFVQAGTGTTTLTASNTFTGITVVSNGTLVVISSVNGDLDVYGGTLGLGGLTTAANVHVGGTLNIAGGVVQMALNKSLSPSSNSFATVDLAIAYTAGSVKLVNAGPSLTVGDKFTLFSQPIPGGDAIPVTGVGFTVVNHLGDDGSVTIATITVVQPPAPTIQKVSLSGTNLVITATNNQGPGGTYALLSTNNLTAPLSTWPVINSGTFDASGLLSLTNPISGGTNRMFFILRAP